MELMLAAKDCCNQKSIFIVWTTGSLRNPLRNPMNTVIEDQFIRKFILGTWYKVWLSEVVIKRRHNDIIICGVVCPLPTIATVQFLMGYTEELLSHMLKSNVKMEVQCVPSRKTLIHKHIWVYHLWTFIRDKSSYMYIASCNLLDLCSVSLSIQIPVWISESVCKWP